MERSIIFALVASVGALVLVLEMVRRQTLREEYSLLWLGTAFVMIIVSTWRDLLHGLSDLVGIAYPPNLLFLLASLFTLLLLLYFSTVITRLTQENKKIAQEVALLRHQIERLSTDEARQQEQAQQAHTEE